jgi:hypothetical protein
MIAITRIRAALRKRAETAPRESHAPLPTDRDRVESVTGFPWNQ